MATTKLTLSADAALVRRIKQLARRQHTSVSALFARYAEHLTRESGEELANLGPLTRRASGMIRLPRNVPDRQLLEDALAASHEHRK